MVIHVDDCFTIGNEEAIKDAIYLIKEKSLELKVEENVKNYLGCELLVNKVQSRHG